MRRARRRLRPDSRAILSLSLGTIFQFSFLPARERASQISVSVGAATRTRSVRDRIGAMIPDVLFATRMRRTLLLYFSIVLRRAAWASRVKPSASFITTTLKRCLAPRSTCWVCATSFRSSCMTTRS